MTVHELRESLRRSRGRAFAGMLIRFIAERGNDHYDELVTQREHALQCAQLARQDRGDAHMVTAALLHDLGHLLGGREQDSPSSDRHHEIVAADFLAEFFPEVVNSPIRLHVPAKRYLCTVDETYYHELSDASKHSLRLQGGVLSAAERVQMEQHPHLERALQLRRYDDQAKQVGYPTPPLEDFCSEIAASLDMRYRDEH